MRKSNQRIKGLPGILTAGLLMSTNLHAGIPVWTYSEPSPASVTISNEGIATIEYIVTNQSSKPKELLLKATPGVSASACYLAGRGSSCKLTLTITGSQIPVQGLHTGPILCEARTPSQCYQPSASRVLNVNKSISNKTSLEVSLSDLALSVNGKARTLSIKNTGLINALNVAYTLAPNLPNDARIIPAFCGTIPPLGTCVLTISPGATATATPGDLNPVPILAAISGSNTNTVYSSINILSYGSVYQGGYIFALNDNPPPEQSLQGKVLAKTYQAKPFKGGIPWGGTGIPIDGVNESSIAGAHSCHAVYDGACNSERIIARLTDQAPGLPLSSYAAGLCKSTEIEGYNDWYLPAICEMSYSISFDYCSPDMENIATNLPGLLGTESLDPGQEPTCSFALDYSNTVCIAGYYWSSTESENRGGEIALDYSFDYCATPYFVNTKSVPRGVRCVRRF